MRILFLSLDDFSSYSAGNIYSDLLKAMAEEGHEILSLLSAGGGDEQVIEEKIGTIVRVKTGQVTGNANLIKKGINTVMLGGKYKRAVKKYCHGKKFDVIVYSTPPITLYGAIKYAKKKTGAKTYLLLKDIFPQNAVDLGILKKSGLKGLIYRYFRSIEKKYYRLSDEIGCMSRKNVEYLLAHNDVDDKKVCINPNSLDVTNLPQPENSAIVREKYGIPLGARVFVYGGNLGRPQDVPFIVECLKKNAEKSDRFFVVSGKGSDYGIIKEYFDRQKPSNMLLINGLPVREYENLVSACDVGLIFLDHRFTIPNYPSRLLSYMRNGLPVIACTDENTDVGDDVVRGGFGWKCSSSDVQEFTKAVDEACNTVLTDMKTRSRECLVEWFSAAKSAQKILSFASNDKEKETNE